ncbi:hypothetical protein A1O7_00110 [Cladophialophora yegresii CBS 114405]|uniref:Uncharacterized protein n=1 Tax=Cladophialophora yegresii CBS 114405 TaxID=1182544 RepID=W9WFJ1_9EURO|nr:uncharacterized protein A1O7_00110 [Cladophialophora yegresii CBS 114405]EXJ63775.1 hypothetical protein A1O7_00110 [Cladophialophora yegresii CBS 114405]
MPGATSSANVEDETDIDVPPELAGNYHGPVCVRPDHDDHRINVSLDHRDSLEGASNYAIAIRSAETCGSSGQNYDLDIVHQRHSARIDIQPDLLELPEALYSKAVDVHARRWLNDFCAGDREGPE